ncbi:putative ATP-binding cassette sub-family A member 3 [Planoprotostelium fungivorum]|uniref:Putative ATP-binding cassette sub-family A member 3 n=1 Tax=Planoprotostelium fungivorum TaxID=1890364 RepID=A0A2P6NS36_9EUKA|nr:putative ATP-binding cassette sub-family A member 3 [Planoprotostelium fungivorum]
MEEEDIPKRPPLEDKTPFWSHVRATTRKNINILKRRKGLVIYQLIFPFVFMLVGDIPTHGPERPRTQDIQDDYSKVSRGRCLDFTSEPIVLGSVSRQKESYFDQVDKREGLLGFSTLPSYTQYITPFDGSADDFDAELLRQSTMNSDHGHDNFAIIYHKVDVLGSKLNITIQIRSSKNIINEDSHWGDSPPTHLCNTLSIALNSLGSANRMGADCKDAQRTKEILRNFNEDHAPLRIYASDSHWGEDLWADVDGNIPMIMMWGLPLVLGGSLPLLTIYVVSDKKTRSIELMKITGMSMTAYWLSMWIFFSLLNLSLATIVGAAGLISRIDFFFTSNFLSWTIFFFLHSFTQPMLSMFLSLFFSKPTVANVVVHALSFFLYLAILALYFLVYTTHTRPPWYVMCVPPFAFSRGVYIISASLYTPGLSPVGLSDVIHGELPLVYVWMVGSSLSLFLLTIYLENVMPGQYGVREPFYFPVLHLRDMLKRKKDEEEEKSFLLTDDFTSEGLIRMRGLKKEYREKKALDGLSMEISDGECVGLLGPNGAGKSTLAHILCGVLKPTEGTAIIAGKDIRREMHAARKLIGFCPQEVILWKNMTAHEHLLFYIRIKGVHRHYEDEEADRILNSVGLYLDKDKLTSSMSAGMKRRLSIAISLVGSPKCLILRGIWDLIQREKAGKCIILTTHNMEEADTLSTSIVILSKGQLVCSGTPLELKRRFGRGYKLSISAEPSRLEEADAYIMRKYPSATSDAVAGGVINYYIAREDMSLGRVFGDMKRDKEANGVRDWSISQTSLEEVFLEAMRDDEDIQT